MVTTSNRAQGWIFLLLFFCSGATALVYEVIWSKYLAQMFGSTIQAQTVVLAVFMGGLALGNYIFGRKSDRLRAPVRVYGILEGAIGVYAFFFSSIFSASDQLFVNVGAKVFEQSHLLLALKASIAVGLLLVPTILMGGTLPLLAAWLQKNYSEAGRGSALFYGINSLGAVAGSGLAGFYLVQTWGMVASLQITALVNLIIGGVAYVLGKAEGPVPAGPTETQLLRRQSYRRGVGIAGVMVAITGGVSMGLEVLASRSLSLIFGSSLQSFAIVLMAFILGIGLGSAAIASSKLSRSSEKTLVVLLLLAAAWVGLLVWNIEGWVNFFRVARTGIARSAMGYTYNQWLSALMSIFILGVPAALIGSVVPLLIRAASNQTETLGEQVGRLLTWNTVGAVTGVLLTGFVIMPQAGVRNAFLILALGLAAVSFALAFRSDWRFGRIATIVVFAGLGAVMAFGGEGWRHVISSGVFRARETEVSHEVMAWRKKNVEILYYKDAPDATVSVERRITAGVTNLGLRINGKPDASTEGDLCTQMLCGHLPIFARPESKDVFLLGMGSGITASAVLAHPIDQLVLAENCKPVLEAAGLFAPWNRDVTNNPKLKIAYEDARTVLKLSPQTYDVIIAEPSNPWTVGVGSVFSTEFYELAKSKLKPGGIMSQWFHVYEMHDGIVSLVLRTFAQVFPYFEIWDCNNGDIVMLGALEPWDSTPEAYKTGILRDVPFADLKRVGIKSPHALFARQLASQRTAWAIPGDGPIQQDSMPVLEYHAPKAFFMGGRARVLSEYDERTWQMHNAPAWKRDVLQSLSDDDLRSIFLEHFTVNDDLLVFVRDRLGMPAVPRDAKIFVEYRDMPTIFRPTNSTAALSVALKSEKLTEPERKLLHARYLLQTSVQSAEAVDTIQQLLAQRAPEAAWPAARYAGLAVKAALSQGNLARAKDLLAEGLKVIPDHNELQYLSRLIQREEANVQKLSAAQ